MNITSFDLYTKYKGGEVLQVDSVEDNSLMYPVYCMDGSEGEKIVSSSVISLIKYSNEFVQNPDFHPGYSRAQWYSKLDTVDSRINKVPALTNFTPKRIKIGKDDFIRRSVDILIEFINWLEDTYKDKQFIVYTGGRDSRIIWCLPKRNPEKFHVFSSHPNKILVEGWLNRNEIKYGEFFGHDNRNDDDYEYLEKKILASDFRCRPSDIRWTRKACELAEKFNNNVIFLLGNAGDTLYSCRDNPLRVHNYINYFEQQKIQTAALQGAYHQTIFNLTGCPTLSIYGYPKLWYDLYQEFEPAEFDGMDLRQELGNYLAGKELRWFGDESTLRPGDWKTNYGCDLFFIYLRAINKAVYDYS